MNIKIILSLLMVFVLAGCANPFGKKTQRETFEYSKSPCACAEQGEYFNGKFYPRKSV